MKRFVLAIGLLASIQLTAQTIKSKATVPFDFRMGAGLDDCRGI